MKIELKRQVINGVELFVVFVDGYVFRRFNTYREAKRCFNKAIGKTEDEENSVILETFETPINANA